MIGLVLATTLSLLRVQSGSPWQTQIRADGWTYRTQTENAVMFIRPSLERDADLPQLWIRYELRPGTAYPSYVGLEEFDCRSGSHRKLKITGYAGRNLSGQETTLPVDGAWEQLIPNSLLEAAFDEVCQR